MQWVRQSAGFTADQVAKKLGTSSEAVLAWESGRRQPTIKTLEKLAEYYKRPLAVFLLPAPPAEPAPPKDFRVLHGKAEPLSPKSRLAIRRARRLLSVAAILRTDLGRELTPTVGKARLSDAPEAMARIERERLGVDIEQQKGWRNPTEALREWRKAVEGQNILVFQLRMPVEEARGFTIAEQKLSAIIVNAADARRARVFTLFHEYAHLLLHQPGICYPDMSHHHGIGDEQRVETWCNRFAGALLISKETVEDDADFRVAARATETMPNLLAQLSSRYKVSTQVILTRMLTLGLIARRRYETELGRQQSLFKRPKPGRVFGPSPSRRCLQEKGRLFVSLVMEGRRREAITYNDVADYLSLRVKHLDQLQALIGE